MGETWTDLNPDTDLDAVVQRVKSTGIGFVVIGPEAPLAAGLADRLRENGVPTFGPGADAAQLEGSKAFANEFMARHGIPTANSVAIDSEQQLAAGLSRFDTPPVVKADGLAAGKGVVVSESWEEASSAARSMLVDRRFGDAGSKVVLEERLHGTEVTVLVLVSGLQHCVLESAQDYKPRSNGNLGPNTGGMGAFSPATNLSDADRTRVIDEILEPTLLGLKAEGIEYRGVLYLGLMMTTEGPKVIEYNVRFGDPETQPLMMRLESDLLAAFEAIESETLDRYEIRWSAQSAVCVVLATEEYPEKSSRGEPIEIGEPASGTMVFHAGTRRGDDGTLETNGGRVFGVTALGETMEKARSKAYQATEIVNFGSKSCRDDIAQHSQNM